MSVARYGALPSVPARMPLEGHVFAILVPIARTNEITNPSFETGTTSWAAVGGSIARVTSWQASGAAGLQITMSGANDGVRYSSLAVTAGEVRACSCWFQGTAGRRYRFQIEDGGGGAVARVVITATGLPQQVVWYAAPTTTATYYLFVGALAAGADVVYLDAVQVEVIQPGETYSTYIDGDQAGLIPNQAPPAYGWNGTPHASTSYRSAQTRAGGMVMPLSYYNFLLTAIIGLGLAVPQNVATDYARLDGAYPDYTRKPTRQLTLTGRIEAPTELQLRTARGDLAATLDRDASALDQRLRLRYWREDDAGAVVSAVVQIDAKYQSGLEGNHTNPHMEDVPLSFVQYAPYVAAVATRGATLSAQTLLLNANGVLLRRPNGAWAALGTGASGGAVYAIAQGNDGAYYIGGAFTSFGGLANTRGIVRYDPATGALSALGTGATTGTVLSIEIAPNGDVWAVGPFTDMGGVVGASDVARWDGTWHTVGTPTIIAGSFPIQVAFGADGSFYYCTGSLVRKWNGAAWSTIGTAGGGLVAASVIRAPNGDIIVIGSFLSMNGTPAQYLARWDGSAWHALNGTPPGIPLALAFDASGILYGVGAATPSDLWSYNGVAWTSIGNVGDGAGTAWGLAALANTRTLYVSGTFTSADRVSLPERFGVWNGSALVGADVDLPGTPTIYVIRAFRDGSLAVGYDTSGAATAAAITTITNPGSARSYPTVRIAGPTSGSSRIYQIVNTTTGRAIYLNLTLLAGDVATLTFQPDNLSFMSAFQGNIARAVLPGSNEADFFLNPGTNVISFFAADSSVAATIAWYPTFASLDDVP